MTNTTIAPEVTEVEERVWVPGLDRCESNCGAEAFAVFTKDGVDFYMCNHHRVKHEDALITAGYSLELNPRWNEIVNTVPSV